SRNGILERRRRLALVEEGADHQPDTAALAMVVEWQEQACDLERAGAADLEPLARENGPAFLCADLVILQDLLGVGLPDIDVDELRGREAIAGPTFDGRSG